MAHDHSHAGHSHAAHAHDHAQGHAHAHAPKDFGRAFAVGVALNAGFVVVEVVFGLLSQSTALVADAGHNLADVLGLAAAWLAATLSKRPPSARYTWGLRNSSVVAALFNASLLFVGAGAIALEAVQRLVHPEPVAGATVIAVALAGILVNGATALLFAAGSKDDLNVRGAFLHMVVDAGVSAGVAAAGALVLLTDRTWIDPLASLVVVGFIVWGTWGLFVDSLGLSMAAVPRAVDAGAARAWLASLPGVASLHDLHIWPVGTTATALSAHLVMPGGHPGDAFLMETARTLRETYRIAHATIQIETDPATACPQAPDGAL